MCVHACVHPLIPFKPDGVYTRTPTARDSHQPCSYPTLAHASYPLIPSINPRGNTKAYTPAMPHGEGSARNTPSTACRTPATALPRPGAAPPASTATPEEPLGQWLLHVSAQSRCCPGAICPHHTSRLEPEDAAHMAQPLTTLHVEHQQCPG